MGLQPGVMSSSAAQETINKQIYGEQFMSLGNYNLTSFQLTAQN